ncbi:unnamed protein product [Cuscuta campestris]|uniref:TF-B3 domain-containing protein n=1 Tax=Cuscuta campestris TaxID=132261 RepID=A0A484MYQ5_9ASTE|nr:unnamed protein product [Cuscuta campestris]
MKKMQRDLPKFFKVLAAPSFRTQLSLPPIISEKLDMVVKEGTKAVKLISRRGMSEVDIQKSKNGRGFSFTCTGWEGFVDEHDLQLGDFLVFEDMGNLIFKVTLFDPTCCEKGFPVQQETSNEDDHHMTTTVELDPATDNGCAGNNGPNDVKVEANKGEDENAAQRQNLNPNYLKRKLKVCNGVKHEKLDDQNKNRRLIQSTGRFDPSKKRQFSLTMKRYNILDNTPYLYLPSAFCKANGLVPQKAKVTLKGPSGEEHQGSLIVYDRKKDGCIHTRAWSGFVASNNLKVGDTCVFKLCDTAGSGSDWVLFDVDVQPAAS